MTSIPADICASARRSYEDGRDPVEYAETCVVAIHMDAYLTITASRAENPASFPGYTLELTPQALARRIAGGLLDAGWASPAPGTVTAGLHAGVSYRPGVSPLGYAEALIAGIFETHVRLVRQFTGCELDAVRHATGEMSLASLSRELIIQLRDAGWIPPDVTR